MSKISIKIIYSGESDNALNFAKEMLDSGIVDDIRKQSGNLQYDYFIPLENKSNLLLIDEWTNQEALDIHHKSDMMDKIIKLREKYKLSMKVEKTIVEDVESTAEDKKYIVE